MGKLCACFVLAVVVVLWAPGESSACCQFVNTCNDNGGTLNPGPCVSSGGVPLDFTQCDPAVGLCIPVCCQFISPLGCFQIDNFEELQECVLQRGIPQPLGCTLSGLCT